MVILNDIKRVVVHVVVDILLCIHGLKQQADL
jgi:hypothetical protein